jgi:hypothetical protein
LSEKIFPLLLALFQVPVTNKRLKMIAFIFKLFKPMSTMENAVKQQPEEVPLLKK